MTIYIPWGLMALFISYYFYHSSTEKSKARKQAQRARLNEKRQEYLNMLVEARKTETKKEEDEGLKGC
jgi:hypothetical protein